MSSNFRLRAASWIVGWAIQVSNFEDLSKKKVSNFECSFFFCDQTLSALGVSWYIQANINCIRVYLLDTNVCPLCRPKKSVIS